MSPYYDMKEGQEVKVHIHSVQLTLTERGIVRRIPVSTGDSWIIEDKDTHEVFYISEGCTITRSEEAATDWHMKDNAKKEEV